jgi:uncharacterized membrane protein YgcG
MSFDHAAASSNSVAAASMAAAAVGGSGGGGGGDVVEAVRSLTASDVAALVAALNATLLSGERGSACAQQLASLYRVVRAPRCCERPPRVQQRRLCVCGRWRCCSPQTRLQSRSVRAMLADSQTPDAANALTSAVYHLGSLVIERKLSRGVRQLASLLLHELSLDEPRTLRPSFRGYDAQSVVPLLLPLLAWCGSAASVAANADTLLNCVATADGPTRSLAILALVRLRERRQLAWFPAQPPPELALAVSALDAQLVAFLSDRSALTGSSSSSSSSSTSSLSSAATAAAPKPSPSKRQAVAAFVGKLSSAMTPGSSQPSVTEPDGTPQRDFFTVLNVVVAQRCSHMQMCDIVAFSALLRWLRAALPGAPPSPELRAAALAHCARVVEQTGVSLAESNVAGADAAPAAAVATTRRLSRLGAVAGVADAHGSADEGAALAEVAQILVELVRCGTAAEAQRALLLLRRAYERLPASAESFVHTSLIGAALHIAAHHRLPFDTEPLVRSFFTSFLPRHTCSSHTALETFELCRAHRRTLASGKASGGNLFAAYFPALFKLFCWTPSHFADVMSLLPLMATSRTFVELFHLLIDLPLVAGALERMHAEGSAANSSATAADGASGLSNSGGGGSGGGGSGGGGSGGGGAAGGVDGDRDLEHGVRDDAVNIDGLSASKRGAERVLYNLLLRSEAGCSFNLWENGSTTLPLLLAFSAQTPHTHLVSVVCERAPLLLQRLLSLLLNEPDRSTHAQLLEALMARIERVPTLGAYGARVRDVMQQFVARLIARRPQLLISQHDRILDVLRDSTPAQLELACVLVFCIGRHLTLATCDGNGAQLALQIERCFQHLEVLSYELSGDTLEQPIQLRLLLLTLSCMAKLACRRPDLMPRVLLCLVSKIRNAGANEQLLSRAQELIRLLRNPVIASDLFEHDEAVRVEAQLEALTV